MTALAFDTLIDDVAVWPAIESLVSCLCTELEAAGLPPTCICAPFPGDTVPWDYVTEDVGMAWVRLDTAYPSSQFPAQDGTAGCATPLAFALEIGALFCAPVLGPGGELPTLSDQFDATRQQLAAMAAMRRAVECCFAARSRDVVINVYTPLGPEGGAVGGQWSIFVAEGAVRG